MIDDRYTVIIRHKAEEMLYDHVEFVGRVSVSAARDLRVTLYNAITSLDKMPFRCPQYSSKRTSDNYRQLIVGRYKVIFTISERDKVVKVRYILDSRRRNDIEE